MHAISVGLQQQHCRCPAGGSLNLYAMYVITSNSQQYSTVQTNHESFQMLKDKLLEIRTYIKFY